MSDTLLVGDAMTRELLTVGPGHTLREVAKVLAAKKIGSAIVHDADGHGIGIITERDILRSVAADEDPDGPRTPESQLLQAQTLNAIDDEIKKLPARQREAFLMRYWEDMDVAETAAAMGCSEGSVKTHCSRATHALAAALSARGIKL